MSREQPLDGADGYVADLSNLLKGQTAFNVFSLLAIDMVVPPKSAVVCALLMNSSRFVHSLRAVRLLFAVSSHLHPSILLFAP